VAELRFAEKRPAAKVIAAILAGSWRSPPSPLLVSSGELDEALSLVARTNAAALAWWRIRDTSLASLPAAQALHDAYRYATLEAELHQKRLSNVLRTLRAESIEPILIKGWDSARLYPQAGLRSYEDIDLVVRPHEVERAQATLDAKDTTSAIVDFDHAEISVFDTADWDGLYERSGIVDLAGIDVRVLSPEDHLRAICIHGLKHCFSNPLWLCDIAVSVERAGPDFDWTHCFGSRRTQSQWIGCAIGLARELLGCEVPAEAAKRIGAIPRWLVPNVLDTWVRWAIAGPDERMALRELKDNPASILAVIARRWPSQLVVTFQRRAPLIDDPLWLQRLHEFRYLFAGDRLVEALLRDKPKRSTP
jgi:hypothetical protein